MEARDFILSVLQREYTFKPDADVDNIDFISEGYMNSVGIIQFVSELENEFNIEFSDEELSSSDFRVIGKLITLVERKAVNNR